MRQRHIGNNWLPVLCLSLLFLTAGAVSMMAGRGNGATAATFAAGTLLTAAVSAGWLWWSPSWWLAPRNHYLYLAGGSVAGVMVSALLPFLHGCGPWLVLGGTLIAYGILERLRLLVTAGGATVLAGFLAMVIHADVWGGAMHLLTAAVLAFTANRLYVLKYGRRRESQDSDPEFIGFFEEYEPDPPRSP